MRIITEHQVNDCNQGIELTVVDEPGEGGASHEYVAEIEATGEKVSISFQNGPIKEFGTNGLTQEVLMAIVIDRLRCFQTGPYACRENALALTKFEEGLHWLHSRTRARDARGVEGTHTV